MAIIETGSAMDPNAGRGISLEVIGGVPVISHTDLGYFYQIANNTGGTSWNTRKTILAPFAASILATTSLKETSGGIGVAYSGVDYAFSNDDGDSWSLVNFSSDSAAYVSGSMQIVNGRPAIVVVNSFNTDC